MRCLGRVVARVTVEEGCEDEQDEGWTMVGSRIRKNGGTGSLEDELEEGGPLAGSYSGDLKKLELWTALKE